MNPTQTNNSQEALYWEPTYLWSPQGSSKAEKLKKLPLPQKNKFLNSLSAVEKENLIYYWDFWARPKQLPPPADIVNHPLGWK